MIEVENTVIAFPNSETIVEKALFLTLITTLSTSICIDIFYIFVRHGTPYK